MWEDQRVVLAPALPRAGRRPPFVARQEIIFGLHVHVGSTTPTRPSTWPTGCACTCRFSGAGGQLALLARRRPPASLSTRTPIFRAFPRVGIPPRYDDFDDWSRRVGFMVDSRVIEDYTYLWYDVRPHPNFGTVEIRVMDAQTRVEHTLALAALIQAMVKELAEHYDAGKQLVRYPYEMLDENKWLAARHGLEGELVDLPSPTVSRPGSWPGG